MLLKIRFSGYSGYSRSTIIIGVPLFLKGNDILCNNQTLMNCYVVVETL